MSAAAAAVATPVGGKLKDGRPGVAGWTEGSGRFFWLRLEKEVLRGVPMDIASGLSGPEMDMLRCLRLTEDLFLRT